MVLESIVLGGQRREVQGEGLVLALIRKNPLSRIIVQ